LIGAIEKLVATRMGLITSVATCASAVFGVGLIMLFTMIRKGVSIAEYLGLKRISAKQVLAVLGIMAGFIILSDGLGLLLDRPSSSEFVVNIYSTSVWPALLWVSLIIFVPIFEETFFRGFLFEGFRQSRLGPIGAVLLTAFAWALLHIQYDLFNIATIFIMGILFGVVRIKTGSLWSTIIMHAFTNAVALLQVALHLEGITG
jgi:membrane protease YdiL (CAAX protease family)